MFRQMLKLTKNDVIKSKAILFLLSLTKALEHHENVHVELANFEINGVNVSD